MTSSTPPTSSRTTSVPSAVAALRQGDLVLIPTETVYGLAANASSPKALAALRDVRNRLAGHDFGAAPSTWHAPSSQAVLAAFNFLAPVQRRLLSKLAPGPVTFVIQASEAQLKDACAAIGALSGSIHDAGSAFVRIPSDPTALRLLDALSEPIVAEAVPITPGHAAALATEPQQARNAALAAGIELPLVIDAGPTTLRRPSARVRFPSGGGWELLEPGPFDRDYLKRAAGRTILFVCTGNTCRSPMAEAIARGLLQSDPSSTVMSAGVGAMDGAGLSPEAVKAVRSLGIAPPTGRSRMLTPGMIASADEIYVMTRSHRAAVLSLEPGAGAKTKLVDPEGRDVADPIGSGQSRYDSVASELKVMIERRLQEGNT